DIKAFARALQRLDELHGVVGVYVIVSGSIIDQQTALEVFGVVHHGPFVVALLVLLWEPHVTLGIDSVVVAEIGDARGGGSSAKDVRIAQQTEGRGCAAVGSAENTDALFVDIAALPKRLH